MRPSHSLYRVALHWGLVIGLAFVPCVNSAFGRADYHAFFSGSAEIYRVGVMPEEFPPSNEPVPDGFRITIDPLFEDPTWGISIVEESSGDGNHTVAAHANVFLSANDPFRWQVGDGLSVHVIADGTAIGGITEARARSSASAGASLYIVNETDRRMYVDWIIDSEDSFYSSGFHPDSATADRGTSLPVNEGHTHQLWSRSYEPHTTTVWNISAYAQGSAYAAQVIPEPSGLIIWGTLVGLVVAVNKRRRTQLLK